MNAAVSARPLEAARAEQTLLSAHSRNVPTAVQSSRVVACTSRCAGKIPHAAGVCCMCDTASLAPGPPAGSL
jgi:hypothetical protein